MTRESRLNFWILGAIIVLSLPGAIMLFRQKMQPYARPLGAPDPVRFEIPYMVPRPDEPGRSRSVPPATRTWLVELARANGATPAAAQSLQTRIRPLISSGKSFEVLGANRDGDGWRFFLLVWDQTLVPHAEAYTLSADGAPLTIQSIESLEPPRDVRGELKFSGYIDPPHHVTFIVAHIAAADSNVESGAASDAATRRITHPSSATGLQDVPSTVRMQYHAGQITRIETAPAFGL